MALCRVYVRADGSLRVIYPNLASARAGESVEAFCAREYARWEQADAELAAATHHDIDSSDLPARTAPCDDPTCSDEHIVRDQWRAVRSGRQVRFAHDPKLPNPHRDLDHAVRDIERELDRAQPDLAAYIAAEGRRRRALRALDRPQPAERR